MGAETSKNSGESAARKPLRNDFSIYKPTRNNTGGALQLSLAREKKALFVEAARQTGGKLFDWQNKIVMKWGLSDIGEVLAVLERRQEQAKLFHQTEKGNTAFEIQHDAKSDRNNYFVQISKQDAVTKTVSKAALPISQGEAAVAATLLRAAAVWIAGW